MADTSQSAKMFMDWVSSEWDRFAAGTINASDFDNLRAASPAVNAYAHAMMHRVNGAKTFRRHIFHAICDTVVARGIPGPIGFNEFAPSAGEVETWLMRRKKNPQTSYGRPGEMVVYQCHQRDYLEAMSDHMEAAVVNGNVGMYAALCDAVSDFIHARDTAAKWVAK